MRRLIVMSMLALAPVAAAAQESPPWTVLTLSESAEREVPADRLVANLRVEQQGEDPRQVQAEVNRLMTAGLDKAKSVPEVKVEGGGYYVTSSVPQPEQRAQPIWTAVQELAISGADAGKVLALAGMLQDEGFLFSDMRQELSPGRLRSERETLLREATTRLRATADAAAAGLGLRFAGWSRISLNDQNAQPMMKARGGFAMAAEAMPAPVTANADINVRVEVVGEARLLPPN